MGAVRSVGEVAVRRYRHRLHLQLWQVVPGVAARRARHPDGPVLRGASVARCFAIEAMAARQMLEQGVVSEQQLAEIASRSRAHAASNPHAVRTTPKSVDEILAEDYAMAPLRPSDLPASSDGGAVIVLAADDKARELCDRPAWIRGIDHRSDAHTLGVRDLTTSMSPASPPKRLGWATTRSTSQNCTPRSPPAKPC